MTFVLWGVGIVLAVFLLTVFRGAPYVPSRSKDIEQVFDELYSLKSTDTLVDIGSGDGKVCLAAANRGAKAIGYEINPFLMLISWWRARGNSRVKFRLADFWRVELPSGVTLVYTFGDARDIQRMADWVAKQADRLSKPIFFLSYAFEIQGQTPVKKNSIYYLYEIKPSLHRGET